VRIVIRDLQTEKRVFAWIGLSGCGRSASEEIQEQHHYPDYQHDVNEAAGNIRITACSASVRISLSAVRGRPSPYGYDGHGNVRFLTNSGLREHVCNRKTSHQYLKRGEVGWSQTSLLIRVASGVRGASVGETSQEMMPRVSTT
jgi:hypothetical protein